MTFVKKFLILLHLQDKNTFFQVLSNFFSQKWGGKKHFFLHVNICESKWPIHRFIFNWVLTLRYRSYDRFKKFTNCCISSYFIRRLGHPVTCLDDQSARTVNCIDGSVEIKILITSKAHVVLVVTKCFGISSCCEASWVGPSTGVESSQTWIVVITAKKIKNKIFLELPL